MYFRMLRYISIYYL